MNESLPSSVPLQEPVRFSWRDWLALALGMALAVLYFRVFGGANLARAAAVDMLPGLGATALTWSVFGCALLYLGRRAVLSAQSVLLSLAALALGVSLAMTTHFGLAVLNCFVTLGVGAMAVFSLGGRLERRWWEPRVITETIGLCFIAFFSHVGKPFRAAGTLIGTEKKALAGVGTGLLIAVPVLGVVLWLLSSADAVFGGLFTSLGELFTGSLLGTLWRILRTAVLGLLLFSALYFLPRPRETKAGDVPMRAEAQSAPYITVLVLLNAVYLIFSFIQIRFLFGGAETAAMQGGYAQYARSGFFQLVAVAAINLAVVLMTQSRLPRAKAVKALCALLLANTSVILVSAVFRMGLYISVYGLSVLRLLTLWGMLVIAVSIGAAVFKLFRPEFRFFRVFFAFALASWVLLSLLRPDAMIANYNVDAYLDGRVAQIDVDYLAMLETNALPALEKLQSAGMDVDGYILTLEDARAHSRYDWTLWHIR